ncbi:hypothetical protein VNO78_02959 [Psophocarpus tetragonolobus]|uniref:Uncharacterized protein n=1 Tax=Psophocarpus tetragonolobus TaxID=3891 RepID=A0AAN9XV60_PSOTE
MSNSKPKVQEDLLQSGSWLDELIDEDVEMTGLTNMHRGWKLYSIRNRESKSSGNQCQRKTKATNGGIKESEDNFGPWMMPLVYQLASQEKSNEEVALIPTITSVDFSSRKGYNICDKSILGKRLKTNKKENLHNVKSPYSRPTGFWKQGSQHGDVGDQSLYGSDQQVSHKVILIVDVITLLLGGLGFQHHSYVDDAVGFSGDIWILWNSNSFDIQIEVSNDCVIHSKMVPSYGSPPW